MNSPTPLPPDIARGVLRKILSGPTLTPAPRLSRLLESCLNAIPLDDEQRAELKRLNRKLDDYYAAEGATDPVRLSLSPNDGTPIWDIRDASANLAAWIPPEPTPASAAKTRWLPYVVGLFLLLTLGAWWYTRTPTIAPGEIKTIAVLPFEDTRTMREQDGLVDGLGAALALELSHLESIRVAAYSSSSQYKFRLRELANIKSTLGADGIVEGTIRTTASDIEGELWIRRTTDGARLWHAPFRAPRAALFTEINRHATEIAKALGQTLPPHANTGKTPVAATAAISTLRALAIEREEPVQMEKRLRDLEAAEKESPKFALAASALAELWSRILAFEYRPREEATAKTREYAAKAQALDKDSPEAHIALGVAAHTAWDWTAARKEYETALRLRPSYAYAINRLAHLDQTAGRAKEALARTRQAHALDPYRTSLNLDLGYSLVFARDYDAALALMDAYEKQEPYHNGIRLIRGMAYLGKGNFNAVESHVRLLENQEGFEVPALALLGVNHARAGRRQDALAVLKRFDEIEKRTPVDGVIRAGIQFAVGQTDEGFRSLDSAVAKRSSLLLILAVNPIFDGIRDDPRYRSVIAKLNLPK